MALNWISARAAASVLPFIGIALALANWNARPDAAWAWLAAIIMFVVMAAVRRHSQLAVRRSPGDAASVRSSASVNGGVVFGALMMIVPLAVTLAHAYGVVDDPDSGRRMTMIILGAYLVVTGNALPKQFATASSMQCAGAQVQAFQRFAGWTWVLCGLGFAMAWLALPIDAAEPVSTGLVATAIILTIVRLRRLRTPQQHAGA